MSLYEYQDDQSDRDLSNLMDTINKIEEKQTRRNEIKSRHTLKDKNNYNTGYHIGLKKQYNISDINEDDEDNHDISFDELDVENKYLGKMSLNNKHSINEYIKPNRGMLFADFDEENNRVIRKAKSVSPKKNSRHGSPSKNHHYNKNKYHSYTRYYSDDEDEKNTIEDGIYFDNWRKIHSPKYISEDDDDDMNTSDDNEDTQLTKRDIEAILKRIAPVAKEFKRKKAGRRNSRFESPRLLRDDRLRYLKEERYHQYDDVELMYRSAYNYEKSLNQSKNKDYANYDQLDIFTKDLDSTLANISPSKSHRHSSDNSSPSKCRKFHASKTIFDDISDNENENEFEEDADVFAISQPSSLTTKLKLQKLNVLDKEDSNSVFSKSMPIGIGRDSEFNLKKPITNVSKETLGLIAKLSAHQKDIRNNRNNIPEMIPEDKSVSHPRKPTRKLNSEKIPKLSEKLFDYDQAYEEENNVFNASPSRSKERSAFSGCASSMKSPVKVSKYDSRDMKTPIKNMSSRYQSPKNNENDESPISPIRTSTIKTGFTPRKEQISPIRTSTMISRRLSPERLSSNTTSRYIPLPDQASAISASMAAKVKPILNIQSTRSVGEMDLSLSENARFIKPSISKGKYIKSAAQDSDSQSTDLMDKKWKLKVKQTSVQRSPTRNHDSYLAKLKEKPDFYSIIEENRRKEKHGTPESFPGKAPQIDYKAIHLKKVEDKKRISNKQTDKHSTDEIPKLLGSRKKAEGFEKNFKLENKKKVFETPEEVQFKQVQKRLLSESPSKIETLGNKTISHDDVPSDSIAIINKIRCRSPERISAIEREKIENRKSVKTVPDDAAEIINKIRSKSPERLTAFERSKLDSLKSSKSLPDDAAEIINKIRSKSPERITAVQKSKLDALKNSKVLPDDAAQVINKIRSKYI